MKTATGARAHSAHHAALYETDFFEWTQRTAEQLRRRRFDETDIEHAAEEIEDMGKRDLRELNSRMEVLMAHVLKWKLPAPQTLEFVACHHRCAASRNRSHLAG